MNAFALKITLVVTIIFGNIATVLIDGEKYAYVYLVLRMLSQMAVPIAAFLLVEGFYHTSNKGRYFVRLFIAGAVSELPFLYASAAGLSRFSNALVERYGEDVKFGSEVFNEFLGSFDKSEALYYKLLYLSTARYAINGLMTLSVSLLMICAIDYVRKRFLESSRAKFVILTTLIMIGFLGFLVIVPFENPLTITFFVTVFYYLRGNKPAIGIMSLLLILSFYSGEGMLMQAGVALGVLSIYTYNGKQGVNSLKMAFYAAYPLQFVLLTVIGRLL